MFHGVLTSVRVRARRAVLDGVPEEVLK